MNKIFALLKIDHILYVLINEKQSANLKKIAEYLTIRSDYMLHVCTRNHVKLNDVYTYLHEKVWPEGAKRCAIYQSR